MRFLKPFIFLVVLVVVCSIARADRPPNIVIILADDLGYGDLKCYNPDSAIPTPVLDRLASEGLRMTDVHSPSSVCTPTRYGLLTGRYAWRTRLKKSVLDGYSPLLIEQGRPTIASMLRSKGYYTAGFGKWHLGLGDSLRTDYSKSLTPGPNSVGFDYFFGIPASLDMPPYLFFENSSVPIPATETIAASEMRRRGGNGYWRAGPISPGFRHEDVLPELTTRVQKFIDRQTSDRPFFLYFALNAPHTPWMPTKEFLGKSGAGYYGDFVAQVDWTAGQVLDALKKKGLDKNTLVIFTSDNGAHWLPSDIAKWGHQANKGLRGQKADIWDGGHRIPFIVRWPGKVPAGRVSNALMCLTDIFSSVTAAAGLKVPDDAAEDSFNLLPVWVSRKAGVRGRTSIIHHSNDGTFAIREGNWKLEMALGSHGFSEPVDVQPGADGIKGQLYDLSRDPLEEHNLWLQRPDIVSRLSSLLKEIQDGRRSVPKRK